MGGAHLAFTMSILAGHERVHAGSQLWLTNVRFYVDVNVDHVNVTFTCASYIDQHVRDCACNTLID